MFKRGAKDSYVGQIQVDLNAILHLNPPLIVDDDFGAATEKAVIAYQKSRNLTPDGQVGPKTQAQMAKDLKALQDANKVTPVVSPQPVSSSDDLTPWLTWMKKYQGQVETNKAFSDMLSKYWPITGLSYNSIAGIDHAWCALFINAALKETGFKIDGSAAAKNFAKYGTACDIKKGCIIVIRHATGAYHVTTFDSWADEKNKIGRLFGGNQSNMVKLATYNVSGNARDHDEIVAVRWPVKV